MSAPRSVERQEPTAGPTRVTGLFGPCLGLIAGLAAVFLTWSVNGDPTTGLLFTALAAAAVGAVTTIPGAVAAAVTCWTCYEGFLSNRTGTVHIGPAGLAALGAVIAIALLTALIARRHHERR